MIVYRDLEQMTDEWLAVKHGKFSGTSAADLVGTPAAYKKVVMTKAFDQFRLPPSMDDGYISKDMQRGIDLEPFASAAIEEKFGIKNTNMGFIEFGNNAGISPDFINEDLTFAAEIKCLQSAATAKYLVDGIDKKHYWQVINYFMIPTVQRVVYAIYIPAIDSITGEAMLITEQFFRSDYRHDIQKLENALEDAAEDLEQYYQEMLEKIEDQ